MFAVGRGGGNGLALHGSTAVPVLQTVSHAPSPCEVQTYVDPEDRRGGGKEEAEDERAASRFSRPGEVEEGRAPAMGG